MELGKTVVHILKGQVAGADPSSLVRLAAHAIGRRFGLLKSCNGTARLCSGRGMIEYVHGLLFHVPSALRRGYEEG